MCGINGIFSYTLLGEPVSREELIATRDHMSRRGPDGAGEWMSADKRVAFAHRRLAIIDLSNSAAQPMQSEDRNLTITFNGEIYNYKSLRSLLESKGYIFRTHSDTEVLLHLYRDSGEEMVRQLRGMFAFSIWNASRREMFMARDPYGIKPLYYADNGSTFRFASQAKALMAGRSITREVCPAAIVGFHLWGSVPEPYTTVRAIRMVPAGSTITLREGKKPIVKNYYSIAASIYQSMHEQSDPAFVRDQVTDALRESVQCHLYADVPVGVFLSGGIDSSAVLGLMRDCGAKNPLAITLNFEAFAGRGNDESNTAKAISEYYGARHIVRSVSQEELQADLPLIFEAMDQPTIDGINSWFISKAASELSLKVALSGLGGDELFGGYSSFQNIPSCVRWTRLPSRIPMLVRAYRDLMRMAQPRFKLHPKFQGLLEFGGSYSGAYLLKRGLFLPEELQSFLAPDVVEEGLSELKTLDTLNQLTTPDPGLPFARVVALESCMYMRNQLLRDIDWASMAHSVEVRLPLVDIGLLKVVSKFMPGMHRLRKSLLSSAPSRTLPLQLRSHRKIGFNVPMETAYCPTIKQSLWARNWAKRVASSFIWM